MRLGFTLLLNFLLVLAVHAQINEESPFPVDFSVTTPASISGSYGYGTQATDGSTAIWGPELSMDVMGELAWAFSDAAGMDSLACGELINDLTDKVALIRRGECDFSEKVYRAQQAGAIAAVVVNHYENLDEDSETLFGMLGGDFADEVTIPAIFISRASGEAIAPQLDGGTPVSVLFRVLSFYNAVTSWSYHMPLNEYVPYPGMTINYVNPNPNDEVQVAISATVTAPSGAQEVLTASSIVAPLADSIIQVDGQYMPTEVGTHTVVYNNDQTDETFTTTFEVTDFTYAIDSGGDQLFSAGPTAETFATTLVYQAGAVIVTDGDGAVATYASFGLENASEVFTGDAAADAITMVLYDADGDDDGVLDWSAANAGNSVRFDDLTGAAFSSYTINGDEGVNEMIYVELQDIIEGGPVSLQPNEIYYITVNYDGTLAGSGTAPRYAATASVDYLLRISNGVTIPITPIVLDQFYNGGWTNRTVAVRLHTDGFINPTDIKDLPTLAKEQILIAPNPVGDQLNLTLKLAELADDVQVGIMDANGRQFGLHKFNQVNNTPLEMDVKALPAGTYFLSILTPEGYRMEKFIKL